MQPSFELFDHTADIGVRVRAADLPSLVKPATDGLYAVIGHIETIGETITVPLELTGNDQAVMLRDYLAEVLFLFEQDHRKIVSLDVTHFDDEQLAVTAHAVRIAEDRSDYEREVKAITYHELAVRQVHDGWEAVYIVDI